MAQFQGTKGEILPTTQVPDWLKIEHVLQRYRNVWQPVERYPYLSIDLERVYAHCASVEAYPVFSNGRMFQNIRPDEGGSRLLSALVGPGVSAGMSPNSRIIVEGIANPSANWVIYFNDPVMVGMHPFAALETHYIYIDAIGRYQRSFGELVVVDKHSRPRSSHVNFDPLADMVRIFYDEYINAPPDASRDVVRLAGLLDAIFVENEKILAAAELHHRSRAPLEKSLDYVAPILTRYGRLTHDQNEAPRIELSFALLHYEKALREFDEVKASRRKADTEGRFFTASIAWSRLQLVRRP